jgi:hypothetical protein
MSDQNVAGSADVHANLLPKRVQRREPAFITQTLAKRHLQLEVIEFGGEIEKVHLEMKPGIGMTKRGTMPDVQHARPRFPTVLNRDGIDAGRWKSQTLDIKIRRWKSKTSAQLITA